jgi:hypothetical protein
MKLLAEFMMTMSSKNGAKVSLMPAWAVGKGLEHIEGRSSLHDLDFYVLILLVDPGPSRGTVGDFVWN